MSLKKEKIIGILALIMVAFAFAAFFSTIGVLFISFQESNLLLDTLGIWTFPIVLLVTFILYFILLYKRKQKA